MATPHSFPSTAATSLIGGYCDDFIQLAATMAQTLEQFSMRNLPLGDSRKNLTRVEKGMRDLADAIKTLLSRPDGEAADPRIAARDSAVGANGIAVSESANRTAEVSREADESPKTRRPVVEKLAPRKILAKPKGVVVFQGNTDSMPVRSVMQFLSRMQKTGTLWISLGEERMTVDLIDGAVAGTTSDRTPPNERVGELLVESGLIGQEELKDYRQNGDGPKGPVPIGAAMVRAGRITEGQLLEALEKQVRRRVERAIRAAQATYSFHEGQHRAGDGRIRIRPFELLGRPKIATKPRQKTGPSTS